ncbi:MAG: redoxin domain-containing protein [Planctomycetota bacterium]|nr:redoxin domain-containing protein [Planctomycetota bacterium]
MPKLLCSAALVFACWTSPIGLAQESKNTSSQEPAAKPDETKESDVKKGSGKEVLAGHSYHGDAFNAGPRQSAYLMKGTGKVKFPVTSKNAEVQKFVEQGLGQIYGFWDLEAERSFRHAAALDPECAIAYWGAALATKRNSKRARGFIDEAVKRKSKASLREQKYIDALNAYLPKPEKEGAKKEDSKKKESRKKRAENYTKALESIALEFPEDIECKALLSLQLYENRSAGIPILSYLATSGLMEEVFRLEPMHPAHHFRIHLWDYKKPEKALKSAALCGQSAPGIAHMWHMPGHIFSRLKRYEDAVWQQEASARVDHAHMMRDRLLPDQIHNFAHNNEWMIRNLIYIGAIQKAIELAKNMSELPRHPKYNTLKKRGSNKYGRERLFQVLNKYGVWDQTISLCNTVYLEPTDDENEQRKRLRALGIALYMNGETEQADKHLAEVQTIIDAEKKKEKESVVEAQEKAKKEFESKWAKDEKNKKSDKGKKEKALKAALDKAKSDAEKKHRSKYSSYEKIVKAMEGFRALKMGDYKVAYEKIKSAGGEDETLIAEIQFFKGDQDPALEAIKKSISRRKNEVIPLARYAFLLDLAGKKEEAKKAFEDLRNISSSIEMRSELFIRLEKVAKASGYNGDWRKKKSLAADIGVRPDLDDLGPIHWRAPVAPAFELPRPNGGSFQLEDFKGRAVIVVFYLGASCLHCAEQLQAFAPQKKKFEDAGIDMIAVSTDEPGKLLESINNYGDEMPIPLMSNHGLDVFKKYRAYDDFEKQPLHGTFLIDEKGLVRWQDISYEPFMDHAFLYKESLRLLSQEKGSEVRSITKAK